MTFMKTSNKIFVNRVWVKLVLLGESFMCELGFFNEMF